MAKNHLVLCYDVSKSEKVGSVYVPTCLIIAGPVTNTLDCNLAMYLFSKHKQYAAYILDMLNLFPKYPNKVLILKSGVYSGPTIMFRYFH